MQKESWPQRGLRNCENLSLEESYHNEIPTYFQPALISVHMYHVQLKCFIFTVLRDVLSLFCP